MDKLIENENLSIEEIDKIESILIDEYNKLTQPYREKFSKLTNLRKSIIKKKIDNCVHDYERFCEYHNDRYYICRKCGHEK